MTNAQKWISIFLGLFIFLLIITYATEPNENDDYVYTAENQTEISGETIYIDMQCANCHGNDLKGTEQGPALLNLAENWTKTELVNFLRNPDDFGSERLKKLKEKFPKSFMPSYNDIETKKLGKLAEYLLEK